MLTACQHQLCAAGASTCLLWLLAAADVRVCVWACVQVHGEPLKLAHAFPSPGHNWHTAVGARCLPQHPPLTSTTPGSDPEASGARQKGEPSLTAAFCFLMESLQVHSGWPSCRSCHR
jgi:hypothetical protein